MSKDDTTYLGIPCKHGHVNEEGKTLRNIKSRLCLVCRSNYVKKFRKSHSEEYAQYQHDYHQKLRTEHPEKLIEYRNTQLERGNNWSKYYGEKGEQL